ncbi:MAG: type II toxin-antitoxin system HipA family toxin [Bdellovibrionales bacterium]
MKKCLVCYEDILDEGHSLDYHKKCSKELFGSFPPPELEYTFEEVNDLAKKSVQKRLAVPGVQPKLSVAVESLNLDDPRLSRLTIVGLLDGLFILKPPNKKFPELPEVEALTMRLAEKCGITTAKYGLIKFKSGEMAYISKRFDRALKRRKIFKIHQEDMCQLTGLLTENKYNSSMEKVVKVVKAHTDFVGLNLIELYQVVVHSFLIGNADMHLKNFSLQYQEGGRIELSPAYDLVSTKVVMPEDKEEMGLAINGKKAKLKARDFDAFADYCEISKKAQENIYKNFEDKMPVIKETILNSFVSEDTKQNLLNLIVDRAARLKILTPEGFDEI